ncbi:MAG: hypothetical protein QUT30_21945 [Acidobacteriota bacterium]|jgi:hypothetical protein|nr:hypothetical protein [Acidobacteriota bacterium]
MPGSKCLAILAAVLFLHCTAGNADDNKLSAETVVAKHLQSIGRPEVLKNIQARAFKGSASFEFIQGMSGSSTSGTVIFASDGKRSAIKLTYNDLVYPGEHFAFDGEDVTVGHISPGQRSPLADFIYRYNGALKEGLLGGVWSLSWPLLDLQKKKPDLKYKEARVSGRPMHELEYRPKKSFGDLKVKLFFDFETFRHVRTEYRVRVRNDNSTRSEAGERRRGVGISRYPDSDPSSEIHDDVPDSIYLLIEKFDDFRDHDGVLLPTVCSYEYSVEGQGNSIVAHWTMKADGPFAHNGKIPEDFFVAQK